MCFVIAIYHSSEATHYWDDQPAPEKWSLWGSGLITESKELHYWWRKVVLPTSQFRGILQCSALIKGKQCSSDAAKERIATQAHGRSGIGKFLTARLAWHMGRLWRRGKGGISGSDDNAMDRDSLVSEATDDVFWIASSSLPIADENDPAPRFRMFIMERWKHRLDLWQSRMVTLSTSPIFGI